MNKKYLNVTRFCMEEIGEIGNKKIVIYGAGKYGVSLISILNAMRLKDRVIFFAVSDIIGNQKYILGKAVLQFDTVCIDNNETIIIVAMNEEKASIVIERLVRQSINNLYWFSEDSYEKVKREIKRINFEKYKNQPIQKNKIFFNCFNGMGYRCNCKYIAEKLMKENCPVELVWALTDIEEASEIPQSIKIVKIDTEEYYKEWYTSSVIVENSGKNPLIYKRKGQFCINTWHGYGPFKKVYAALPKYDASSLKDDFAYYDLFLTASRFYLQVYRESFRYEGEVFESGAPRNDILFSNNCIKEKIYHLFNISSDKKILLFAPTFRYDNVAAFDSYYINVNKVLYAMSARFGGDYILMYRFHHELYKVKERVDFYKNGIDVTVYPDIQELLVAADVVITDYSSLMWDFSLQRKPVFLYQSDAEEYENNRGFYVPVSEWPYPQAHTQEELLKNIDQFDEKKYRKELNLFLKKYGSCDDGHAAERVVRRIMDVVEQDETCDEKLFEE